MFDFFWFHQKVCELNFEFENFVDIILPTIIVLFGLNVSMVANIELLEFSSYLPSFQKLPFIKFQFIRCKNKNNWTCKYYLHAKSHECVKAMLHILYEILLMG